MSRFAHRRWTLWRIIAPLLILSGLPPARVAADDSRPFYLQVAEAGDGFYELQARAPAGFDSGLIPELRLPEGCFYEETAQRNTRAARFHCTEPLAGRSLDLEYQRGSPAVPTIVRLRWLSGMEQTRIVSARQPSIAVPLPETHVSVARDYTVLGIKHIWVGIDHLLFVACLIWIAGTWRRVLVTITGFTIAHSATLGLAALGYLRVPVPPVEAAIALSVVFLALEITKGDRNSLTWRYPIAVAASFGLLHGLGFAAALAEVGLPRTYLLTGLLFFNVGVEIGQVVFAGAMLTLFGIIATARRKFRGAEVASDTPALAALQRPAGYVVGSIATFWLIERCQAMLG